MEEYKKKLAANAVTYINMDSIIKGNYSYRAIASPLLFQLILNVTKSVHIDENSTETVFDRWLKNEPNSDRTQPLISPYMGSGSDFSSFQQKVGLPCIDQLFVRNAKDPLFRNTELTTYPLYHTKYDSFELVSQLLDKGFKKIGLMALIVGEMTRQLADSAILPFNCNDYAKQFKIEYKNLEKAFKVAFPASKLSEILMIDFAIKNFTRAASLFHNRLSCVDLKK